LSDEAYSRLLGASDLETIFAGLLDLLRDDPADLAGAMGETIRLVTEVCGGLGIEATLNLAVTDGTTWPSPVTLRTAQAYRCTCSKTRIRAPEPSSWPPSGWMNTRCRKVPDRHLLSVRRGSGATLSPL
jgi:hypothetical protein